MSTKYKCPCGNGEYQYCCQPLHLGALPETAQALMQSRYSAFVLKNIDYIIQTTLPAEQHLLDKSSLQAWADSMHWTRLDIISHTPKVGKRHALVHFRAHFDNTMTDGKKGYHDEHSAFVRIGERWYFLDPTIPTGLSGKNACLCGSGEKFKTCCGKFLY